MIKGAVGWKPYKQFDLDANQDSLFCQNGFYDQNTCIDNELRNYQISEVIHMHLGLV